MTHDTGCPAGISAPVVARFFGRSWHREATRGCHAKTESRHPDTGRGDHVPARAPTPTLFHVRASSGPTAKGSIGVTRQVAKEFLIHEGDRWYNESSLRGRTARRGQRGCLMRPGFDAASRGSADLLDRVPDPDSGFSLTLHAGVSAARARATPVAGDGMCEQSGRRLRLVVVS